MADSEVCRKGRADKEVLDCVIVHTAFRAGRRRRPPGTGAAGFETLTVAGPKLGEDGLMWARQRSD